MSDEPDPNVSAVVTMKVRDGGPPDVHAIGFVKQKFSMLGFEVHAPFHTNFSIAGKRSLFERVFGLGIVVDPRGLAADIRTEAGGYDLPLDALPEDARGGIASVAFMPPPAFPTGP